MCFRRKGTSAPHHLVYESSSRMMNNNQNTHICWMCPDWLRVLRVSSIIMFVGWPPTIFDGEILCRFFRKMNGHICGWCVTYLCISSISLIIRPPALHLALLVHVIVVPKRNNYIAAAAVASVLCFCSSSSFIRWGFSEFAILSNDNQGAHSDIITTAVWLCRVWFSFRLAVEQGTMMMGLEFGIL